MDDQACTSLASFSEILSLLLDSDSGETPIKDCILRGVYELMRCNLLQTTCVDSNVVVGVIINSYKAKGHLLD